MVLGFVVHISNQASVQALHDTVEQYFSRCLDILVNNIGDMELLKPFLDLDADIC
jgi:NAD(P)-dependent dehydrogenase (short-subunit alcohol dehydrogenase family)